MEKKRSLTLATSVFLLCILCVALGRASVGDITLDDTSTFEGNMTVTGLGSFGSLNGTLGYGNLTGVPEQRYICITSMDGSTPYYLSFDAIESSCTGWVSLGGPITALYGSSVFNINATLYVVGFNNTFIYKTVNLETDAQTDWGPLPD